MSTLHEFHQKFAIKRITQNPSVRDWATTRMKYPIGSMLHYVAEGTESGYDINYPLMAGVQHGYVILHQKKLLVRNGAVQRKGTTHDSLVREYQRYHPLANRVKDFSRLNIPAKAFNVVNYGILPLTHKLAKHKLNNWQMWSNISATMWKNVNDSDNVKINMVPFGIPTMLPSKADFEKYANKEFTSKAQNLFGTKTLMNWLHLFKMVTRLDIRDRSGSLNESKEESTYILFTENGKFVAVRMSDLINYSRDNEKLASGMMYNLFTTLSELKVSEVVKGMQEEAELLTDTVADTEISKHIITQAEQQGMSKAQVKAMMKLSNKYKVIKNPFGGNESVGDLLNRDLDMTIDNKPISKKKFTIHDKSMYRSSISTYDKTYLTGGVFEKDLISVAVSMQKAGYIVKTISDRKSSDAVTDKHEFSIGVQPIRGKASTLKFPMPTIHPDGTFKVGGIGYRMAKQRGELPIAKTTYRTVALTSYYGKNFIERNPNVAHTFEKWFAKRINLLTFGRKLNLVNKFETGTLSDAHLKLPPHYRAIANQFTFIDTKSLHLRFTLWKMDEDFVKGHVTNGMYPCGEILKTEDSAAKPLAMDWDGNVHVIDGDKYNFFGYITEIIDPNMPREPMEYSQTSLYGTPVPLVMIMIKMNGLVETLKIMKVKYESHVTGVRVPQGRYNWVLKLKDITYDLKLDTPEKRMMFGGLVTVNKISKNFTDADLNQTRRMNGIMNSLKLTTSHLKEMVLMDDMFIDPITMEQLILMKEPTEYEGLLIRSNELLSNDEFPVDKVTRYKGYERFAGMMYGELVRSIRTHRGSSNPTHTKLQVMPSTLWLNIAQDETVAIIEESNPIHNCKEQEATTSTGNGGRGTRSMTKITRKFEKSDVGVISEASPDSGKVGIRTFTSVNPVFENVRGVPRKYDKTKDGPASHLSVAGMISPGTTHDDAKRVNHTSVQLGHVVACDGYQSQHFRTGYEDMLAHRVSAKFATTAKQGGKVVKVKDDLVKVEFDDGTNKTYPLGIDHGSVSGKTIPHRIVTNLKNGDSFEDTDIITYNEGFFEPDIFNKGGVTYKAGAIMTVAFMEHSLNDEDGCIFATVDKDKLTTKITKVKGAVIDFDTVIHDLVTVGTRVTPDSVLGILDNSVGGDDSSLDEVSLSMLAKVSSRSIKCGVSGVVSKVEVLYYGELDDMHPGLRKLADEHDILRAKRSRRLQDGSAKTGKINESVQMAKKKLLHGNLGVAIYIDTELKMQTGDKLVIGLQLKSTISEIWDGKMETEDGIPISISMGQTSPAARIVKSIELIGTMNYLMEEASAKFGEMYFK